MKNTIYVLADAKGKVIATVQKTDAAGGFEPLAPEPMSGQKLHTLELPSELVGMKDPNVLHERLEKVIQRC